MKVVKGRSTFVKLVIIGVFAAMFIMVNLLGKSLKAGAASSGPSPSHTSAPGEDSCVSCHASFEVNSGTGSLGIMGIPANYIPGQPVEVTVRASQSDAVIYGFQITAIDSAGEPAGTFSIPVETPMRTQIVLGPVGVSLQQRQYVEHTVDGLSNGQFGFNSWTFTWTAPSQAGGKIDFYAAGNAADSDGSPSGDYIYTKTASSVPATSFMVGGRVTTPNGIGVRSALVFLTGPDGLQINTLTNSFGFYNFPEVPAGFTYIIRVSSKRYRFASKSVTVDGELTDVNFIGLE